MTNKTLLDKPEYYALLYRNMLKEIEASPTDLKLYFPKWKKDVLLSLLEKAKPNVKRKFLRKKVILDLKRISDEAWEEIKERL